MKKWKCRAECLDDVQTFIKTMGHSVYNITPQSKNKVFLAAYEITNKGYLPDCEFSFEVNIENEQFWSMLTDLPNRCYVMLETLAPIEYYDTKRLVNKTEWLGRAKGLAAFI